MERIVTLTMNPALDIGTRVPSVAPEIKLRCAAPQFHPGGGGLNVSRAIRFLGGESTAVFTAGGPIGDMLIHLLGEEGITNRPIPIAGITREGFAVYEESTKMQYRFNMPGPVLGADEWTACLEAVFDLNPAYIVASGSLPQGVPAEFYGEITRYARQYHIRVILDTAGDALHKAFGQGVYLMKPNLHELELFAGEKIRDENHVRGLARRLIAEGLAEIIVVSMGAAGASLITEGRYVHLRAPLVNIQSRVGAGDSMVGGLAMGLAAGRPLLDAVRFGMAAGSAAVMTPGTELCRREDAYRLYEQIAINS